MSKNVQGKRRVVMVGPSLASRGGMASVAEGYRLCGLFDRWRVIYLDSHVDGTKLRKAFIAGHSFLVFAFMLIVRRAVLLHIHVAERVSFWRKIVFISLAFVARCPVVFHLHGGAFVRFFRAECGTVGRYVVRWVLRKSAYVIVLSSQWKDNVLLIESRANVVEIVNFVSLPYGRGSDVGKRCPVVIYLGWLGKSKGIYDLVVAVSRLKAQFPSISLRCGGNGELEGVEHYARELGIGDHIDLLGWIRGSEKERLFSEAAVYVLPSYNEGMPMSILEAMAHGIPIVASRAGGIPDVIDDGENGFLIEAGDVDALTVAIERLLNDGDLRARMGAAARRTVEEKFSPGVVIPRLEGIYRSLGARPVA